MQRTRVAVAVTALLALILVGAHPSHAERPNGGRSHQQKTTPVDPSNDPWAGLARALGQVEQLDGIVRLVVADEQAAVVRLIVAQEAAAAEQARQAQEAELARQRAVQRPIQQPAPAPAQQQSSGGSCYGGVIPDYIVNRESGGDPNAMNPSGAWGCYQIMPEWWAKPGPTGCAQFDRYTIDGQKACAAVLWNGGAGASNWSTG